MKVLQLCSKPPYPTIDGGTLAMHGITLGLLNRGVDLKVLTVETDKHPLKFNELPKEYIQQTGIESVYIDTRIKPFDAFVNLFSSKSYNVSRFYNREFEIKLESVLKSDHYDIVHADTLFVMPYLKTIREFSVAKLVYRPHNAEYVIWQRSANGEGNILKRMYLRLLVKRLKSYEENILREIDGLMPITEIDASIFKELGYRKKAETIQFGLDYNADIPVSKNDKYPSLFFLGAMDWLPNKEGVLWFFNHVWSDIKLKYPDLKFYLAGKNSLEFAKEIKEKDVIVEGEVKNAHAYISENNIFVVPLLSGSGIRIKIIEGMALGKTIVTTSVGAEGIDIKDGFDILIGDSANDFKEKLILCIENKEKFIQIGENAKKTARNKYDNNKLAEKVVKFYQRILKD